MALEVKKIKLPQCTTCDHKLSWKQTFKQTMIVKKDPLQCPQCDQKLFYTAKSKKRVFLLVALLPILFVILVVFQVQTIISVASLVFYVTFVVLVVPFLIEVTQNEEALF